MKRERKEAKAPSMTICQAALSVPSFISRPSKVPVPVCGDRCPSTCGHSGQESDDVKDTRRTGREVRRDAGGELTPFVAATG